MEHEPDNPQGVWCCDTHRDEFNTRQAEKRADGRYTRKQSAPLTDGWIEKVIQYGPQQVGQVIYDCALEIKKLRRDLEAKALTEYEKLMESIVKEVMSKLSQEIMVRFVEDAGSTWEDASEELQQAAVDHLNAYANTDAFEKEMRERTTLRMDAAFGKPKQK